MDHAFRAVLSVQYSDYTYGPDMMCLDYRYEIVLEFGFKCINSV